MRFWIGIDDTDSAKGMCTTYLAVILIERLERAGMKVEGFPRLIRLNPTIPFKTRGNGAVSFLVNGELDEAYEITKACMEEYSMLDDERTNPGAVFVDVESRAMNYLPKFAEKVIRDVVSIDEALFVVGKFLLPFIKLKLGRGIIGALAAVGAELNDYTLELLAYRKPERFGTKRVYDRKSFFRADKETYPLTWDTVDWQNDVVVAVPSSPDPVLYGIRGDSLRAIKKASKIVVTEDVDRSQFFITNQGTDMHIIDESEVEKIENFHSYKLTGIVVEKPYYIEGGHVFFYIKSVFGKLKCAAFEPTKQFRDVIRKLEVGDLVEVYGSVKKDTLNLEKINVVKIAEVYRLENPFCPVCKKRMESAGRGQGYRCKRCGTKAEDKIKIKIEREIEKGYYEVPPCARRHLSKPLIRMKVKNAHIFR
ncbi:MAG: tRNA(Ile2) 2-agmatinylcytidine synthetase [Archaeoglobus sp.]|nr:MAG: tRNA(Ile2) 2-agmatinylcytidine synthetase [Archaeoglobus sp.]